MKLYEISDAIERVLAEYVDPETGEITDEGIEQLEKLELDRKEKALAVAAYLKGERAEAEAIGAEVKRLAQRQKTHERRAQRLEDYLAWAGVVPGEKLEDARSAISWRKSTRVLVENVEALPEEFVRTKVEKSPDKVALKKALQSGREVNGAALDMRNNLVVR